MKKTSLTLFATFVAGAAVLLIPTSARAQVFYAENENDGSIDEVSVSTGLVTPFVTAGNGLGTPYGLVSDSSGNLFESDNSDGIVNMITRTGSVSVYATGLNGPVGLAINSSGVLFESDSGSNTINEVTSGPLGTNVSAFLTSAPVNDPMGLAFDNSGNLYEADAGNGIINKITPSGTVTTYSTGFSDPTALAFDQSGDLFVTDLGSNEIDEIAPGGGSFSSYSTGLSAPIGLAFDSAGNLYDTESGTNSLNQIASNGSGTSITTGLNGPTFIALQAVVVVPEPSTYLLGLLGLGLLALEIRRRRSLSIVPATVPVS